MSEIAATATEEILATTNEDKLTPKQKDIQLSIFNIGQNLKYPMTLTSAHDFNSLMEILDDSKFKKSITQDKDALKESRDLLKKYKSLNEPPKVKSNATAKTAAIVAVAKNINFSDEKSLKRLTKTELDNILYERFDISNNEKELKQDKINSIIRLEQERISLLPEEEAAAIAAEAAAAQVAAVEAKTINPFDEKILKRHNKTELDKILFERFNIPPNEKELKQDKINSIINLENKRIESEKAEIAAEEAEEADAESDEEEEEEYEIQEKEILKRAKTHLKKVSETLNPSGEISKESDDSDSDDDSDDSDAQSARSDDSNYVSKRNNLSTPNIAKIIAAQTEKELEEEEEASDDEEEKSEPTPTPTPKPKVKGGSGSNSADLIKRVPAYLKKNTKK